MTRKVGNILIIEPEPPTVCALCGEVEETRPYGPNGENVCHGCGMKDPEAVNRGIEALIMSKGERPQ